MTRPATYLARRCFRAMGTDCTVLVYGDDSRVEPLADLARRRVDLLESLWSRFRGDSELSRLNARSGEDHVDVSAETEALIRAMRSGWEVTAGAFDPSVLAAITAAGYDRDFAEVVARDYLGGVVAQAPGMAEVRVGHRRVFLPRGVGVDPGAIGKGLAADIVVDEMVEAGATGVLVDLGGDIAFAGYPGHESHWRIALHDERDGRPDRDSRSDRHHLVAAGIEHAGIATSTTLTRRWAEGRHHVIDPATANSTDETLVHVTVAGKRAWECEVWATAVLVRPAIATHGLPEDVRCLALGPTSVIRDDFQHNREEQVA